MLNKKKLSFTEGPLFFRILTFAIPIMLTGILQIMCLTGACAFRVFWRYVIFPLEPFCETPNGLLLSFPLSWVLTILLLLGLFVYAWKKLKRTFIEKIENTADAKQTASADT